MKQHSSILANKLYAVVGPTASGKTSFSIDLAKKIDGEIISADSRLVYKGFNIGTAKPTLQEQDGIPHYMIDIVEPEFDFSVALYKTQAEEYIKEIQKKRKIPIIVGGTGLYIDTLLRNFDIPQIEPNRELRDELNKFEIHELYEILDKFDKNARNIINTNDKRKIIRAIEIIKATGNSLENSRKIGDCIYDITWLGKNFERKTLYARIDKRVDEMIDTGLIDETKFLLKKHGQIPNLIGTIGYREIISYLKKECSLEEAISKLKQNTRRYAKRQLTWFRRNENIQWDVYPEKLDK